MILQFEGRTWDIDPATITVDEWRELKRKYKMTPKTWEESIQEADPDASTFLYWVMLRRDGQMSVPLGDQLKPDILALNAAIAAAAGDDGQEQEAEAEPDPTSPPAGGASPAPGSPTTTTLTPSAAGSPPAQVNGGTATSNGYAPSTSAPSLVSATSTNPMSGSSP